MIGVCKKCYREVFVRSVYKKCFLKVFVRSVC